MSEGSNKSDERLVAEIKQDITGAFDILFDRYSKKLYAFALSILKSPEDAKEVIQEVFYKLWNKRQTLDKTLSFKSYIFKISYNAIIDILRQKMKSMEYQNYLKENFSIGFTEIEEQVSFNELNEKLNEAVEELPERRKEVYKLSREEFMSHKEISALLNISVKTIENHITASLHHIRNKLDRNSIAYMLFLFLML